MNNPFDEINSNLLEIRNLLGQVLNNQNKVQLIEPDRLGGLELAQEITGLKKNTIYNFVHYNKIPFTKKGGKLYFSKKELENWIKQGNQGMPSINLFPKYRKAV